MIYADNAATTRVSDEVLAAMLPFFTDNYGNASTIYKFGRGAHTALENSRRIIADILGAMPSEIFFTSGGSESNNWALKGTARRLASRSKTHIVSDAIEHPSVLNSLNALKSEGVDSTLLLPDKIGRIAPAMVSEAITDKTGLVSIMYANNEIGTIQPVAEIGALCHEHGVLFHTDAVQAAGILPIDVTKQNIDLLSLSAHKFHGPKGIGVLYARRGLVPVTLIDGGEQERGHRAGTENVALAVGAAKAFELAAESRDEVFRKLTKMRDIVRTGLAEIPDAIINGDAAYSLPGIVNVSFRGIDGQSLIFRLDLEGVCASSGSACASGSVEASHVLQAIGVPYDLAHGSLRISLGKYNTVGEAHSIVEAVKRVVMELRGNQ